jgi:hypothetical protein
MNDQLKAQLKGLQHPSALLRRQATLGVFALLVKSPQPQALLDVLPDVLLTCLTDTHPVGAAAAAAEAAGLLFLCSAPASRSYCQGVVQQQCMHHRANAA